MDEPRKRFAAMMSGLDIHYDLGAGHPLVGRRMPDLDLLTADGPLRVFALLHDARPVLLNFGEPGGVDKRRGPIGSSGQREMRWRNGIFRCLAWSPRPVAVLIRPDGYVAWAGDGRSAGLADALTTWFGPPSACP